MQRFGGEEEEGKGVVVEEDEEKSVEQEETRSLNNDKGMHEVAGFKALGFDLHYKGYDVEAGVRAWVPASHAHAWARATARSAPRSAAQRGVPDGPLF